MEKQPFRTHLCDMLNIEYPVMLAAMGVASGPKLVAAVSNAGGIGVIGAIALSPELLRVWIERTRELTDKPFGVDLLLPSSLFKEGQRTFTDEDIPIDHVKIVEDLFKEIGIRKVKSKQEWEWNISDEIITKQIEVVLQEKVPLFVAALGSPKRLMGEFRQAGIKVMGLAGNVRNALYHKEADVDLIGATGSEAGGHVGRIGTVAVVPQIVDAVKPIPVVAAGGIGDGRGLVASLALGATGVWVGTRFLVAEEAWADCIDDGLCKKETVDIWKEKLIKATAEDAIVSRVFTGKTARTLRNKLIDIFEERKISTLPMPLQSMVMADLQFSLMEAGREKEEYLSMFGGQVAGMISKTGPAEKVVSDMIREAREILLNRFPGEIQY